MGTDFAEWIATGFPGCEPAFPVDQDKPRAVDEGFVIVEPDEVKTKAQPSTGRKEVWTYTAVVLVAGLRYAFAEATAEGLWLQVSALLLQLGVLSGERRLLVLGDGAAWIRAWFESLRPPDLWDSVVEPSSGFRPRQRSSTRVAAWCRDR